MPARWKTVVASLLVCVCGSVAGADDPAAPLKAHLARLQALRTERPGDGTLVYYQAMTHAALGERDAALAQLRSLLGRKLGLVPAPGFGFEHLQKDADFIALRNKLAAEEDETLPSPVSFKLDDPRLIPEGIAFDPRGQRFFVGSIARRKIVAIDRSGRPRDFSDPSDGLDAVLGLFVDARRGRLDAVSTNGFEMSALSGRRNAVVRYDLRHGRLAARLPAPAARQLNDVTVAVDGTVYATDSAGGTLFRARPGNTTLTPFGTAGTLPGANGIVAAPDGAVYVALSTGIARVDATTGVAARLPQPDTVATGGIDGLAWHDGALLGIQNVTNPGRVIRIGLADAGARIDGVTVLQSHHHPEFDEPTTGVVAGQAFHVIANSHVARFQPDGRLKDAATLKPPVMLAVPLAR
ncbi:hypothetical protein [Piscinibacter sp.]|uniref:hypothetical protein n=1 Tax=Piscinibacter sp. TaxID=1903157 RepID=UPI002D1AB518|nr:hypothetical protein [Albitalea sp.]HUG21522.1 hypothetical protein [Albitalea sp.]